MSGVSDFATVLQSGNAWLFIPSAILLGALHGLEPGHSKTMMAAFIVAVRGTVSQAVLLGLAATASHTAIVWVIALAGLHFGARWNSGAFEPYFQLASAVLIIAIAVWMLWRTSRTQQGRTHSHHHGDETKTIDTGHGTLTIEVFEQGVPPRWRVTATDGSLPAAESLVMKTLRPDGTRQTFAFELRGQFLESVSEIPEPHAFKSHLILGRGSRTQTYDLEFHEHNHKSTETKGLEVGSAEYVDEHERAHADDIRRRFANQHVTTGQIIMFGLTGGLIPCPSSITVLLLCLQLKKFTLGVALVLCFSVGLALTMVAVGAAAALSVNHVSKRWSGFGEFAHRAPYVSSALIIGVGLYTGYIGLVGLQRPG